MRLRRSGAAVRRPGPRTTAAATPAPRRAGARRLDPLPAGEGWRSVALHHWQCLGHGLGYLMRTPLASLMTVAVIAISLALPAGMYVLLKNAQQVSAGWNGSVQISLFLKNGVGDDQAHELAGRVQAMGGVAGVDYISPGQALADFKRSSGFGEALDALPANPLPGVLVVHPAPDQGAAGVQGLLDRLRGLAPVDQASLDMAWVQRLYAIVDIVRRGVLIVAGLLAAGVLLIVGNTIRLAILNRRQEIEVKKMIGATNTFVRRPFLYYGWWYGVLGGVGACILVELSLWALQGPVRHLSLLYGSGVQLAPLGAGGALVVVAGAALLGYLGAWLAVGRHLSAIEPT